jgi:predicted  nucleic acid-binding Zn-ribbon protein
MNKALMLLIQLQNLILGRDGSYRSVQGRIGCLRNYIPEIYLNHFDLLLRRRRMAVAALTDADVCGGCLHSLPAGSSLTIRQNNCRLHNCPFCGCFLYADPRCKEEPQTWSSDFYPRQRRTP